MTAILTAIPLLLASSVTAQEKPRASDFDYDPTSYLEYCEETVDELNFYSEVLDRVGGGATERVQTQFTLKLGWAYECAAELTKRTGKKYKLTKDWFGSDYTLKKP